MKGKATSTLATRLVLNANPPGSWVRTGVRAEPALVDDIKAHGVKMPLLLLPDFRVVDGAKRLLAASALHLTEVPVRIANNWDDVYSYFIEVRRREEEEGLKTEPLQLRELNELFKIIVPLYGAERVKNIGLSKRKPRPVSPDSRSNTTSTVNRLLGQMMGMASSDVAVRRNIFAAARKCVSKSPELGKEAWDLIDEAMARGARIYSLEGILRDMAEGRPVEGRRLYPNARKGENLETLARIRVVTDPEALQPDARLAAQQQRRIDNILMLLKNIGDEADTFEPLNAAFPLEDAERLLAQYKTIQTRISKIRRVLWSRLNNQGERE